MFPGGDPASISVIFIATADRAFTEAKLVRRSFLRRALRRLPTNEYALSGRSVRPRDRDCIGSDLQGHLSRLSAEDPRHRRAEGYGYNAHCGGYDDHRHSDQNDQAIVHEAPPATI